jgi:hypothetical protein
MVLSMLSKYKNMAVSIFLEKLLVSTRLGAASSVLPSTAEKMTTDPQQSIVFSFSLDFFQNKLLFLACGECTTYYGRSKGRRALYTYGFRITL